MEYISCELNRYIYTVGAFIVRNANYLYDNALLCAIIDHFGVESNLHTEKPLGGENREPNLV